MTSIKDFIRVEYLQSSGTQYLNTGFTPNQNTSINVSVEMTDSTQDVAIIGCKGTGNNRFSLGYGYGTSELAQNFFIALSTGQENTVSTKSVPINTRVNITCGKIGSNLGIIVDDTTDTKASVAINPATPLRMFAREWNGNINAYSKCKIYSCKIWDNGTLVRDFQPCIRHADYVAGLYDLVNNVFYENQGTGSFITGPAIDLDLRVCRIPTAYEELLYIQSSGTQYIDTGVTLTNNSNSELVYAYNNELGTNGNFSVYGSRTSATENNIGVAGSAPQFKAYIDFGNYTTYRASTSNDVPKNTKLKAVINKNLRALYNLENNTTICSNNTLMSDTFTTPTNVLIFDQNGGFSTNKLIGKVYSCKMWDNNTLVRNFIPARKKSTNVVGMYDTVTETFYTNAGDGTFTAGPVIITVPTIEIPRDLPVIPSAYQEYEGLTATGTQWIDTGFTPNQDTKLEIQYSVPTVAQNGTLFGSRETSGSNSFCTWGIIQATTATRFDYGPGASSVPGSTVVQDTKITLIQDKNRNYQDGVELGSKTYTTFTTPHSAYLFNMYSVDGSTFPTNGTIYSCRIYDNGTLVRNFKPVKRISDNVCGMWDTVTEQFYTNISGTGSFTVSGNVVVQSDDVAKIEVPKVYQEYETLEYLETLNNISTRSATANAFIDTGIIPSGDNYKYEIKFNRKPYPSSAAGATVGIFGAQNSLAIMCLYSTSGYYNGTQSAGAGRITDLGLGNDTDYIVTAHGNANSLIYTVNGTTRTVTTNTSFDSTMTKSINLFKNNNDVAVQPMNGKIYYFKLWKDNKLICDMIPVRKRANGELGMLDRVTNTFKGNAGDGTVGFTAGHISYSMETVWTKYDLPSTYIRKNYLQSSGTQWINTGVTPTQNTKALYSTAVLDDLTEQDSHLFGSRYSASSWAFDLAFMNTMGNGYNTTRFISSTTTTNVVSPLVTTDTIKNKLNFYMTSSEVKVDDTQIMTFSTSAYTSTYPLWLFGVNNAGTLHGQVRSQKVWGCKIWDGTTLVRDFVPVQKVSNSEYGMYDLVTDTFYGNAGTGSFTAG